MDTSKIKEDLEVRVQTSGDVKGNDHVATVDHMDGENYIKLAKKDSETGEHRWIPVSLVEKVDDEAVYLNCDRDAFQKAASTTAPSASA